jgi:hypothetical protein
LGRCTSSDDGGPRVEILCLRERPAPQLPPGAIYRFDAVAVGIGADVEMSEKDTPGLATCGTTPEAVVALLFNVSDIAATVSRIERLLEEEDDGEEEADRG